MVPAFSTGHPRRSVEAGEGNRTLISGLEGRRSTIELRPRGAPVATIAEPRREYEAPGPAPPERRTGPRTATAQAAVSSTGTGRAVGEVVSAADAACRRCGAAAAPIAPPRMRTISVAVNPARPPRELACEVEGVAADDRACRVDPACAQADADDAVHREAVDAHVPGPLSTISVDRWSALRAPSARQPPVSADEPEAEAAARRRVARSRAARRPATCAGSPRRAAARPRSREPCSRRRARLEAVVAQRGEIPGRRSRRARRGHRAGGREHERRGHGRQDDGRRRRCRRRSACRRRRATSVRSSAARRFPRRRLTRPLPGIAPSAAACRATPAGAPRPACSRAAARSPRRWPRPRCAGAARSAGSRAARA